MTDSTIIVSMTSYPLRIKHVASVWKSILDGNVPIDLYHCVLVLCREEFKGIELPSDLIGLIDSGCIELLWHDTNIMSHKKIVPVVKKYPHNPILVIDDDVLRQEWWLDVFIKEHLNHPNDVICSSFCFHFDEDYNFYRYTDFPMAHGRGKCSVPSIVHNTSRPASGYGGMLIPGDSFKDMRFFDEKSMMDICPTCDESWMYCFLVMADKEFRQTERIWDETELMIEEAQDSPLTLCHINRKHLQREYMLRLISCFPEFEDKLKERFKRKGTS